MFKLSIFFLFIASYAAAQGSPGLRGADRAVEDVAVDEVDDVDAVAAMARNPSDEAYEYAAGEVTPPPVLFANPIGEDYFVRGFDGDKSYQWDDEWDDDAPSDE